MDLEQVIKDYICEGFAIKTQKIESETSLLQILDSMSLSEILFFLESRFHIRIEPSEVALENLDTIERMAALVRRKQAK